MLQNIIYHFIKIQACKEENETTVVSCNIRHNWGHIIELIFYNLNFQPVNSNLIMALRFFVVDLKTDSRTYNEFKVDFLVI